MKMPAYTKVGGGFHKQVGRSVVKKAQSMARNVGVKKKTFKKYQKLARRGARIGGKVAAVVGKVARDKTVKKIAKEAGLGSARAQAALYADKARPMAKKAVKALS